MPHLQTYFFGIELKRCLVVSGQVKIFNARVPATIYRVAHKDLIAKILVLYSPWQRQPIFFTDSRTWVFRLSNEVSFIPEYHLEGGQESRTKTDHSWLLNWGLFIIFGPTSAKANPYGHY